MKNRRKSRILALQLMYAWDLRDGEAVDAVFVPMLREYRDADLIEGAEPLAEDEVDETVTYARLLAATSAENCAELDVLIQQHAANWDVKRMAAIDRNLLRLAITELRLNNPDVPFRVVIDESVEIAKEYGTDESSRFVNGVIDAINKAEYASSQKKTD